MARIKMSSAIGNVIVLALVALGMLVVAVDRANGAVGATTICKWKDNKTAAYTFSVDDNCVPEVQTILDILNPRGIKGTWFVITGPDFIGGNPSMYGTWDFWRSIIAQGGGHELASHSVTHPDLTALSETELRAELLGSKTAIEQNVPDNGKCLTFAYPGGSANATVRGILSEYYIMGRSVGCYTNLTPTSPSKDTLSEAVTNGLMSVTMWTIVSDHYAGLFTTPPFDKIIDKGIQEKAWLFCFEHNITSDFTAYNDYLYAKRDTLWFATARDVSQYIWERDTSIVQVVSTAQSQIILNLTHNLDTTVCNFTFPLTLKTEVSAAWDSVTVVQGTSTVIVKSVNESGKQYVYFDAQPNKGPIMLSVGVPAAIAQRPLLHSKVENKNMEKIICPSPIKSEILYRYLQTNKNIIVCDLAGKIVTKNILGQPGVYLVEEAGTKAVQKVLVIK